MKTQPGPVVAVERALLVRLARYFAEVAKLDQNLARLKIHPDLTATMSNLATSAHRWGARCW